MESITRQSLVRALAVPAKTYVYSFGCNPKEGLGADFVGLLKTLMVCLNHGIGFRLCTITKPRGFATKQGWADYFEPIFEEAAGPFLEDLNLPRLPYQRRAPFVKPMVRSLLKATTRPAVDYFELDDVGNCDQLIAPVFSTSPNHLDARAKLFKILWQLNPETRAAVDEMKAGATDLADYASAVIRRGDKHTEASYVALSRYVAAIDRHVAPGRSVFLASDDARTISEMARLMPHRRFFSVSDPNATGYVHAQFKKLPPAARRRTILRHLAELELLWGARQHIGSKTVNASWMVNAWRGGDGMLWLD